MSSRLPPALRVAALTVLAALAAGIAPARAQATPPPSPPTLPASPSPTSAVLPRGEIVDPVASLADPAQTYALYLPSAYTPERRWPMLLILDARGRGRLAADLFRQGAESYGWIVASSNTSASDGPWEPNERAINALLGEAEHRFAADLRRLYVAGFSGTARGAWAVGLGLPGAVAGVIAASGGFPQGAPPAAGLPFAVFATAGSEDFNYLEIEAVGERLEALGLPHQVEFFAGRHAWPPAALCTEALAWFELEAMKTGRAPRDEVLIDRLYDRWLGKARALEAAGEAAAAQRRFAALARAVAGLRDAGEAAASAARLAASPEVAAARGERERLVGWERARRREVEELVAALQAPGTTPPPEVTIRAEALIRGLRRTASAGPLVAGEASSSSAARRVLEYLSSFLAFYLPRDLLAHGEYARALTPLELAVEIHDDNPGVWYNLACVHARAGSKKRALEALARAIAAGFADRTQLERDEDLASLRKEKRYREMVAGMQGN